jgi:hypothetical protein
MTKHTCGDPRKSPTGNTQESLARSFGDRYPEVAQFFASWDLCVARKHLSDPVGQTQAMNGRRQHQQLCQCLRQLSPIGWPRRLTEQNIKVSGKLPVTLNVPTQPEMADLRQ